MITFNSNPDLDVNIIQLPFKYLQSDMPQLHPTQLAQKMNLLSCSKPVPPLQFSSVQFIRSVMSDSLQPHESQCTRPPCPSQTPRVYSNSCPSSRGCHPAISSSVVPFSSCPQSLPASGSFPTSQLFAWGAKPLGVPNYSEWYLQTPRESSHYLPSFMLLTTLTSNHSSLLGSFIFQMPSQSVHFPLLL